MRQKRLLGVARIGGKHVRTINDIKRDIEFIKKDIRELGKIRAYTDAAERDFAELEKELAEAERRVGETHDT